MSSGLTLGEKTRLVNGALGAYASQDLETLLAHLHPDIEWVPPIALAEGREFRGHAGVREWWADLTSTFEGFRAEVEDSSEVGDRLLSLGRLLSHGRGSAVEISEEVGWVWEFRNGRISSMRIYLGHDAALAAIQTAHDRRATDGRTSSSSD